MQQSESIKTLFSALAKAKSKFEKIEKDKKNSFKGYEYSSLDALFKGTQAALNKEGLSIIQFIETHEAGYVLTTLLAHSDGEWIKMEAKLPIFGEPSKGNTAIQEIGMQITYFKRYQYASILGLYSDADLDGEATGDNIEDAATISHEEVLELSKLANEIKNKGYVEWFLKDILKIDSFSKITPSNLGRAKATLKKQIEKEKVLPKTN